MRTLYLECKMGCAGDMLMGALSELVDQKAFVEKMNALGLEGIHFEAVPSSKCGVSGTHMKVTIDGEEEGPAEEATFFLQIRNAHHIHHILDHIEEIPGISQVRYEEDVLSYTCLHDSGEEIENKIRNMILDHEADAIIETHGHRHHHHDHHGMHVKDIQNILESLPVSSEVKEDALAVYRIIAEAESHVHGVEMEDIHFHEVGTMDALADVVGNCILFEMIHAERIYVSPVALGNGMVKCAHGILPVPAPATAYILQGIPTYSGRMEGELCTPTGAALLKHFGDVFDVQPSMKTDAIGYGMGNKDFPAANCVRAFLGEAEDDGEVCELKCNIDDITGESIGYAFEVLFQEGALDVYVTSVSTKKNRPGYVFTCMCKTSQKDKFIALMFKHLTTLGIREYVCPRHCLHRSVETIETSYGPVHIKKSDGFQVHREKLEYEDLARIARENDLSIEEITDRIKKEMERA